MVPASRAYLACRNLFNEYPLAVSAANHVPTIHSIVLMLGDDDDVRFFVLVRNNGTGGPTYTLCPWRGDGIVSITADGDGVPDPAAEAVMRGVPLPQDGSMFGWTCQEIVTALIVVFARYTPETPVPAWSVMPLAGIPKAQWPPFTCEHLFGHWFWEHYQAGDIVSLDGFIAETPETFFWVDTQAILGSDCCVVARDIKTPEGRILRRGKYLTAAALQPGAAVPSLTELLADTSKIDLAPRFQADARGNS